MWTRISLVLTIAIYLLFTNKWVEYNLTSTKITETPILKHGELLYEMTTFYNGIEHLKYYAEDYNVLINYKPKQTFYKINSWYAIPQIFSMVSLVWSIVWIVLVYLQKIQFNSSNRPTEKNVCLFAISMCVLAFILWMCYSMNTETFIQKKINYTPVEIIDKSMYRKIMFKTSIEYTHNHIEEILTDTIEKALVYQPPKEIMVHDKYKIFQIFGALVIGLGSMVIL